MRRPSLSFSGKAHRIIDWREICHSPHSWQCNYLQCRYFSRCPYLLTGSQKPSPNLALAHSINFSLVRQYIARDVRGLTSVQNANFRLSPVNYVFVDYVKGKYVYRAGLNKLRYFEYSEAQLNYCYMYAYTCTSTCTCTVYI